MFTCFKIHKPVRLVPEFEAPLLTVVGYMKKQYLVFVIFQVLKRFEQFVGTFLLNQIAEKYDQRTLVNILGNHVQGIDRIGLFVELSLFLFQKRGFFRQLAQRMRR